VIEDTRRAAAPARQCGAPFLFAAVTKDSPASVRRIVRSDAKAAARPHSARRVRGKEAFTYLRTINSGHPGSITTVHSDSRGSPSSSLRSWLCRASEHRQDAGDRVRASIIPIVIQGDGGGAALSSRRSTMRTQTVLCLLLTCRRFRNRRASGYCGGDARRCGCAARA